MSRNQLGKVWSFLAILLLFYALNTWLSSQSAPTVFNVKLLNTNRVPGAYFGILVCAPLLILLCFVGILYRSRHCIGSRWNGIPPVGIGTLDVSKIEGKIFLVVQIALFVVIPALSLVHFANIVTESRVCAREYDNPSPPPKSLPEIENYGQFKFPEKGLWFGDRYRLDGWDRISKKCSGGITFFPFVSPLCLIFLCGTAFISTVYYLGSLMGFFGKAFVAEETQLKSLRNKKKRQPIMNEH
jgi:hypothetical protein